MSSKKKASGILFSNGVKVLLLKRAKDDDTESDSWAIPGGRADGDENDLEAAIRETMEETGLKEIPGHRIGEQTAEDKKGTFTTYVYRIPTLFDVKLSEEHDDWKWVTINEIFDYNLHPKFEESLPQLLAIIRRKITDFKEWSAVTKIIKQIKQ